MADPQTPGFDGRMIVHDQIAYLDVPEDHTWRHGDVLAVLQGDGPTQGEQIGAATVTGFENNQPIIDVHCFDDDEDAGAA